MTKHPARIKQDINFMENPLWFQDERLAEQSEKGYIWQDKEGFLYRAGYKPPVKTDAIFLLYLLHISQQAGWKDTITLSRYQIIKGCGMIVDSKWYARLEDSLRRWKMVSLEFHGTFYDKKEYISMMFGVIDSWDIDKKTKQLRIYFSPKYLTKVRESSYFRFIDFNQVKALRSPLATRLFEILSKMFQTRDYWETDAVKLARKIPMAEQYASDIVLKVSPAVKRIARHTDLNIILETRKKSRGEIILVFTKHPKESGAQAPALRPATPPPPPRVPKQPTLPLGDPIGPKPTWVKPKDPLFLELLALLPFERRGQKSLQGNIWRAFQQHGAEYVAWNIRYANKRAIGNYPAYLLKALKGNYGQVLREEEEVRAIASQKKAVEERGRAVSMTSQQVRENADSERAQAFLAAISPEARKELEEETMRKMPPFLRSRIEKQGPEKSISFQSMLRQVALGRLKAKEGSNPPANPDEEKPEVGE